MSNYKSIKNTFPIVILIGLYLCYGLILVANSQEGFPNGMTHGGIFPYLSDKPLGEDGYYMLTVAWNIASGKGIVYNYDISTSGIQPLNTFFISLLGKICLLLNGDKWTFARIVLFYEITSLLIFSFLIYRIAKNLGRNLKLSTEWLLAITTTITIFNFGLFRIFAYGLETGLYLILFAFLILYELGMENKPTYAQGVIFGLLSGFIILTRIDFLIPLIIFHLISFLSNQKSVKWVLLSIATVIVVVSPWFLYVNSVTGRIIPSSGIAQFQIIDNQNIFKRLWEAIRSLISHLIPWVYSRPADLLSLISLLIFIFVIVYLISKSQNKANIAMILEKNPWYKNWVIAIMILILVYIFGFKSTHFYTRYFSPLNVVFLPFLAIVITEEINQFPIKIKKLGILFVVVLFFVWAFLSLHTGFTTNTQSVVAGYIEKSFVSNEKIGAFQSGVVGYFHENVFNLDGKIDHRVIPYLKSGTLDMFLDLEEINVVIDWADILFKFLPLDYIESEWNYCKTPIPDEKSICIYKIY